MRYSKTCSFTLAVQPRPRLHIIVGTVCKDQTPSNTSHCPKYMRFKVIVHICIYSEESFIA